jgi:DNA polymerase III subunit gamma/tau
MRKEEDKVKDGFHLEFRPKTWEEVRGNEHTVKSLREMLSRPRKPHSYLLFGPTGCGKTTLARLMAQELGCHSSEFFEMNTGNLRGIDTVREVIESALYVPTMGKVKVYLFDEAHQITGAAADALLKFLEDTPRYVYIILATTNPEKLSPTVKGRLEKFQVHPLRDADMLKLIMDVMEKKEIKVSTNDKIVERIYEIADGCPREALLVIEKLLTVTDVVEANKVLDEYSSDAEWVRVICGHLLNRMKNWSHIVEILKEHKEEDIENTRRGVLGYMQSVLLNPNPKMGMDKIRASEIIEIFGSGFWEGGRPKLIQAFYKSFLKMQELK